MHLAAHAHGPSGRQPRPALEPLKTCAGSQIGCDPVPGTISRCSSFLILACGGEVVGHRPDPAVYRLALDRLGLPPEAATDFEDTPHGVSAAVAAGLRCVAIPHAYAQSSRFAHADLVPTTAAHFPWPRCSPGPWRRRPSPVDRPASGAARRGGAGGGSGLPRLGRPAGALGCRLRGVRLAAVLRVLPLVPPVLVDHPAVRGRVALIPSQQRFEEPLPPHLPAALFVGDQLGGRLDVVGPREQPERAVGQPRRGRRPVAVLQGQPAHPRTDPAGRDHPAALGLRRTAAEDLDRSGQPVPGAVP
ncbi:HAD-IA family hydrolase [Actinoplanes hulinensis]|uniref:HAD-IA family hydrolase n=1 Tax=Actinoplanes hulinensis TaxID=1144547 RepID=A0ABS7BFN2_9ACTN|nr:HAD-IA family hydrolase [Actinoplanes hulinensis]